MAPGGGSNNSCSLLASKVMESAPSDQAEHLSHLLDEHGAWRISFCQDMCYFNPSFFSK
jgi:hypothetical protein